MTRPRVQDHHQHLSRRERQIMDVVYAAGETTINEIHAGLPDPPTHTAVRTLVKILVDKGVLKRRRQGREYLYTPRFQRQRVGRNALENVIQTFYEGSLEKAVGAHLASQGDVISSEELYRLRQMIDEARRQKRDG